LFLRHCSLRKNMILIDNLRYFDLRIKRVQEREKIC
jgi:hypothetical protein